MKVAVCITNYINCIAMNKNILINTKDIYLNPLMVVKNMERQICFN